eukprot:15355841-Ditylum_brightwellii.AAC.1
MGTINAYMHEGPASSWLHWERLNQPFNSTTYEDFDIQDGHQQGCQMCHTTMSDTRFAGMFQQANKPWIQKHKQRCLGPTYRDVTPQAWADTYLAYHIQHTFAHHLLHCMWRVTHQRTQNKLPNQLQTDPLSTHRPVLPTRTSTPVETLGKA